MFVLSPAARRAGPQFAAYRPISAGFVPLLALLAVLLPAFAGLGAPGARAVDPKKGADTVVAWVNDQAITAADVDAARSQLPPQYRDMPADALFKGLVEQLIDRQLVVAQARSRKLDTDPEVRQALKQLEVRLLEQFYLRRIVEAKVTDKALLRRYERDKKSLVRDKKVRARHILVKTRDEAIAILREISQGKDFAQLAREKSIGPSKTQGGDLGYFSRDQMVPAFSAAAFSLRKGEVSRAPVQTQYGWHIIKVEDIQDAAPPKFDAVKEELRAKMSDEVIEAEFKDLRKGARIEIFGPTGQKPGQPAAPAK